MRKLVVCQGCGGKQWVDKAAMIMPKHRKGSDRSRCPMSGQKVELK